MTWGESRLSQSPCRESERRERRGSLDMKRQRISALFLTFGLLLSIGTAGPFAAKAEAARLDVCGTVSAYVPATILTPGAITIGGIPFVISAGTTLSSSVQAGANLCFGLTIDLSGRITDATVTGNVTSTVTICGTVTAYVAATASSAGSLTIAGQVFTLAVGSNLPASVDVGANLCLDLTLNAFGQVLGGSAQANVTTTVTICGTVTTYVEATLNSTGSLRIAGRLFTLAQGSNLPASVDVGADLCLDLTLNALAQVQDGSAQANVTTMVTICGTVTAYTEATLNSTGSLRIAGRLFTLALGSDLPASVDVGADLCLTLTLNALAQVQDGSATANVTSTLKICGTVTSYTEATLNSTGLLRIAGRTFTTALDSNLPASVEAGADLCLTLTLNALAQVQDGTATANVTTTLEVCGQITVYAAATFTNNGSLTVAGVPRTIAAGADVDAGVAVGVYARLRLTIDVFGRVSDVTVLKVGASLAAACNAPTPTPTPGATPSPTPKPTPKATPTPNGSPTPTPNGSPTPTPNGSPTPTPNGTPSSTPEPNATPTPMSGSPNDPNDPNGGGVANQGATCQTVNGNVAGGSGEDLAGFVLPDTASLERTARVIITNAVPLGLLAAAGLLAGYVARRRRQGESEVQPIYVDATDEGDLQ